MTSIIIDLFKPVTRNLLRGFARVRMPSGFVFHDVPVHHKGDDRWVSPPSEPILNCDGVHIKHDGKPVLAPIVSFSTKEARDKFSNSIVAAIGTAHLEEFH
jgi:hypothetical protein